MNNSFIYSVYICVDTESNVIFYGVNKQVKINLDQKKNTVVSVFRQK